MTTSTGTQAATLLRVVSLSLKHSTEPRKKHMQIFLINSKTLTHPYKGCQIIHTKLKMSHTPHFVSFLLFVLPV